jgi:cellulose synthase/poly-beta-1,6-N-acetylglucosamine synthase-like glycosyltransferase
MDVDVIILSNTTTNELFDILKQTVDSIHDSEPEHKFNVIVVESCKEISSFYTHKLSEIRAKFVIPQVPKFNYNLYLNIGLRECKNDLVLITNNDVIYYKGWFTSIAKQFEIDPELMSVSPIDRKWHRHTESIFSSLKELHIGTRTSYEFTGWSFIVRRKLFDLLGGFDERFAFYYQDNDWVEMYNSYNVKHGLCTSSHIHHLLSKSHGTIKAEDRNLCSMDFQHAIFKEKWNTRFVPKPYKRLSLLVCTVKGRENYLERLKARLKPQLTPEVEILVAKDNRELTIGKKRNDLIHNASGEYIAFIDDDDWVSENYVKEILKATDSKPDVVGFNSIITFNGKTPRRVEITMKHKNWSHKMGTIDGTAQPVTYYRCPNHLTPVKKSIALKILFPEMNDQEDRFYSLAIPSFAETEVYINDYLYFYDCRNPKRGEVGILELLEELKLEKVSVELAEKYIRINA